MKLGVNKVKKRHGWNIEKNLNLGIKGIECQELGFLDIFSETGHQKFLIFCMMVEGNRGHHLSVVLYLGKILIRALRV